MLGDMPDERPIGYAQALALTLGAVAPLPCEPVPLSELAGRVAGADAPALVDVPAADVSLKDGYAVRSPDVQAATRPCPVRLESCSASRRPASHSLARWPQAQRFAC